MKGNDKSLQIWLPGKILLDEFEILEILGRGGMGEVYLVRRISTDDLFAVKTLLYAKVKNDHREHLFLNELRVWMELPDYPHLSACRFFRTVEDRIVIFAEYVDGESLTRWIQRCENKTIEMILDIAIQFAWGLHAAHIQGVVHQDIKPDNVLVSRDQFVKVTDFGLSRALEIRDAGASKGDSSDTAVLCNQGMTLAYCSPEQAMVKKLTYRTDIWSFGLSFLQMLTGTLAWRIGALADDFFEMIVLDPDLPDIPAQLVSVLKKCFQKNPCDRWQSMDIVAGELQGIYQELTGKDYPRKKPVYPALQRTRSVEHDRSTVTGRSWDDPMVWLNTAFIAADMDTEKIDKEIPVRTGSRFSQAIVDLEIFNKALSIFSNLADNGDSEAKASLGLIYRSKARVQRSLEDLPGAIRSVDQAIDLWEQLRSSTEYDGYDRDLARTKAQKASLLAIRKEFTRAIQYSDEALEYFHRFPRDKRNPEDIKSMAETYQTRADALWNLKDNQKALEYYDKAIAFWQELASDGHVESHNDLAKAIVNKGNALLGLGQFQEALELYNHVIRIRESFGNVNPQFQMDLAKTYFNKSLALLRMGNQKQRLEFCEKAIAITERLVTEEHLREYIDFLSLFYTSKAGALTHCDEPGAALETYEQAIEILERQFFKRGRNERASALTVAYTNKANVMSDLQRHQEAIDLYDRALKILDHLIRVKDRQGLKSQFAEILVNKGDSLRLTGDLDTALRTIDQAIDLLNEEINGNHRKILLGDLGWARVCRTKVLLEMQDFDAMRSEAIEAIRILESEIHNSGRTDLKDILEEVQEIIKKTSI